MQGMQTLLDCAPCVADHVPAGQGTGVTVPGLSQTEPAGHVTQTPSDVAASCAEYVPAAHSRHVVIALEPVLGDQEPARQGTGFDEAAGQ